MSATSPPTPQAHSVSPPLQQTQADKVSPLLNTVFAGYAGPAFSVRFWDDSIWRSAAEEITFEIFLCNQNAWRTLSTAPDDVSLGEKYIKGEIEVAGDLFLALRALPEIEQALRNQLPATSLRTAAKRLFSRTSRTLRWGAVHSKRRDAAAISHHYDLPPEFYKLFLGPTMVYSCAYFRKPDNDLYTAQCDKMDLICRKLELSGRDSFLDIGCGWGSLVLWAAEKYGVVSYGASLSQRQVNYANERINGAKRKGQAQVYLSDFRDLSEVQTPVNKLASVGMCEHVGLSHIDAYFREAYRLLLPEGLFLNHGITRSSQVSNDRPSFIDQYVFPDGELLTLTEMVRAAEDAGFEVRDVENLREHYEETLHRWVEALCHHEAEAIALTDEETFRIWKLYMTGSAEAFRRGDIAIHQLLLSKNAKGHSSAPKVREGWYRKA